MALDSSTLCARTASGEAELATPRQGLSLGQRRVLALMQDPVAVDELAQRHRLEPEKLARDLTRLAELRLIVLQGPAMVEPAPAPAAPSPRPGCGVDGSGRHRPRHAAISGSALGRRRDRTFAGGRHLVRHALRRTDNINHRQGRGRARRAGGTASDCAGAKAATLPETTPPAVAPTSSVVTPLPIARVSRDSPPPSDAARLGASGADGRDGAAKNNGRARRERTAEDHCRVRVRGRANGEAAAVGPAGRRTAARDRQRAGR